MNFSILQEHLSVMTHWMVSFVIQSQKIRNGLFDVYEEELELPVQQKTKPLIKKN